MPEYTFCRGADGIKDISVDLSPPVPRVMETATFVVNGTTGMFHWRWAGRTKILGQVVKDENMYLAAH